MQIPPSRSHDRRSRRNKTRSITDDPRQPRHILETNCLRLRRPSQLYWETFVLCLPPLALSLQLTLQTANNPKGEEKRLEKRNALKK